MLKDNLSIKMAQASTLLDALQASPKATAIFCTAGGPRLTYSELQIEAVRIAATLRNSGIRPGDTVSIADTNTVWASTNDLDRKLCGLWHDACDFECASAS
jgi:acyl-CoA synthetase (AMP-forming)/AMP-acid ligase II